MKGKLTADPRGMNVIGRSAEVVASVGATQTAYGNLPDLARIQYQTFTSRLASEVAFHIGQGVSSVSFSELVNKLRETGFSPGRQASVMQHNQQLRGMAPSRREAVSKLTMSSGC